MSYISTNHLLNPLTEEINDPLVNSLTVYSNSFIHWAHLNFGYHVEHHLFPNISPKYAPIIQKKVLEKWPKKYKKMNHFKALKLVYDTPRFYEGAYIHTSSDRVVKTKNFFYE